MTDPMPWCRLVRRTRLTGQPPPSHDQDANTRQLRVDLAEDKKEKEVKGYRSSTPKIYVDASLT